MFKLSTAAVLAAFACVTVFAAPLEEAVDVAPLAAADTEGWRLPLTIMPVNYNIILQPYLDQVDGAKRFTFSGEVAIQIVPTERTNKIIMHSRNLTYVTRKYWSVGETIQKNLPVPDVNETTNMMAFTLTEYLTANKAYILHFNYTGIMDDDMYGFYRSSYVDAKNNVKWIGSTQFQTNHARRAFPSFDEPKFKATFDVTIKHNKTMLAYANTPILKSTSDGDYVIDVFDTTPKISTYLLAFIVSEFTQRSTPDNSDKKFGVIARPEYYDQSEYSFNVGQELLDQLENYLNISYYSLGNSKMDMAAIPDFSAGAMENWGLLTFREEYLLYQEGSTTLSAKQSIATVVAHEQAHMWFGDLVTCDWWSYTWLNEGFANYFEYFATAMVESSMALDQQFVVDQVQSVMGMDATNSTNPMSDENTNTPSDLSRMFNSISYNKGGSFIRMVKHAMGEENFRNSLHDYLENNKFQNTVPQNLSTHWLNHWPSESKSYANAVFKSFTEQVGYPVVRITFSEDGKSFDATQKRFLLKPGDGSDASLQYTIPLTYTTDKEKNFASTTPKQYLEPNKPVTVNVGDNVNWLIVNIQETGYYRVNYDTKYWHRIHHALYEANWDGIHELNRAQIVDDLFNLARSGEIEYDLALEVLEYLETETNYLPWTAAFNGYSYLAIRLGTDTENFGIHIQKLAKKAYEELGFEEKTSDTPLAIYNRAKILSWSCKYGNSDCTKKALSYFDDLQKKAVPVNIRSVVYCTAMREGNETNFDILFNKYKTETVATEQTLILNTLGCVRDIDLVKRYFWIIVGDDVRRQDKSNALSSLYTQNNENITPVYDLVTENVDKLAEALGSYDSVADVISQLASMFTEQSQEAKLKAFNAEAANQEKWGSSFSTLKAAEATVPNNLQWSSEKLGVFKSYLAKRANNSATTNVVTVFTLAVCALVAMIMK